MYIKKSELKEKINIRIIDNLLKDRFCYELNSKEIKIFDKWFFYKYYTGYNVNTDFGRSRIDADIEARCKKYCKKYNICKKDKKTYPIQMFL